MLHVLLWSFRLGELNDDRFSPRAYERFASAVRFLASITDANSGQAPNYGSNDGALILPLNTCDYSDYRPVLQASYYLLNRNGCFRPDLGTKICCGCLDLKQSRRRSAKQLPALFVISRRWLLPSAWP